MTDWQGISDDFAELVRRAVNEQFPDAVITEPNAGHYIWRRGSNIVQMMVRPGDQSVQLSFIAEGGRTPPPQTFPFSVESTQGIANAIVEWLDFRRHRQRGL